MQNISVVRFPRKKFVRVPTSIIVRCRSGIRNLPEDSVGSFLVSNDGDSVTVRDDSVIEVRFPARLRLKASPAQIRKVMGGNPKKKKSSV